MSGRTSIEWTDGTWNPHHGCVKVSPGCKLCYMYRDKRRYGQKPDVVVRSAPATFRSILSTTEYKPGSRVFVCSWSDFFVEQADLWRREEWELIAARPDLTFQILTKRPERIGVSMPLEWNERIWLGVSVETPDYVGRIDTLRRWRATCRFVSAEPLLADLGTLNLDGIGWLICGGESGPGARPTELDWARSLRDQCAQAGTAFFMKQITDSRGRKVPFEHWPEDLQVREFPKEA